MGFPDSAGYEKCFLVQEISRKLCFNWIVIFFKQEALNRENNRKLFGSKIVVEYVKSKERGGPVSAAMVG